ncbi:hypothetical protein BX659_10687 [Orenia metallireducens]|uniref:Uncharacterized protein n=1 Tax=Orenia metallireducens TaxID=1413210 RepID=A0A285GWI6_9FIRM|nr:hypothetical protein [Orenia metallireducens]PRX31055.1 hypothetical protein BX659_10687 [Orenia metallireducens]SNY27872.1 hypothetical protein SAMN06265827_111101 [Orenia metallireducens]
MKEYIGLLSIIYIVIIIAKLKANDKSFEHYIVEYQEIKFQLKLVSQSKNPFVMMKFSSTVLYILLVLYYTANIVIFSNYPLISLISYTLIIVTIIRLSKKVTINSVQDFEKRIKLNRRDYRKQQRLQFCLGLVEFAYAFNALILISFYY